MAAWLGCALALTAVLFLGGSRETTVAGHDAVVRPTVRGDVVVRTGPVLPDLRLPAGSPIGVDLTLGKTDVATTDELVQRYALIASSPEGAEARVRDALGDLLLDSALRGGVLALLPLAAWTLLGPTRRRELAGRVRSRRGAGGVVLVVVGTLLVWQPWNEESPSGRRSWVPLAEVLGPQVPVPDGLDDLEVSGDVTTRQTERLVRSAIDTYDRSRTFYRAAATSVADLQVRRPEDGETTALLVSDRHDNVQMDAVARALADVAGATVVLDAGDDTSSGKEWEGFSLDSLTAAFDDGPFAQARYAVTGNHDNGPFVGATLADQGWRVLDGDVVDTDWGGPMLGVGDPRASGLGSWRDEKGLSFDDVRQRLADAACAAPERISTMLVHDAALGREALVRGCVDLVVGGHLHVQRGPNAVVGTNGEIGWSYTNGTTGGAAYAIALGTKPRRAAGLTLLTYRDGRPVGVQPVQLDTDGVWSAGPYTSLTVAPR